MKEFVYHGKAVNIKKAVLSNVGGLGYASLNKALRNKDVKINGIRVNGEAIASEGDKVTVYVKDNILKPRVIFSDENILIVFKRGGIETADGENSLLDIVRESHRTAQAVHRLDANTQGLVVFALNSESERELLKAFRERTVEKHYLALVSGFFKERDGVLTAYLTKDSEAGRVTVHKKKTAGAREIITSYKVLAEGEGVSALEVGLITGATHQIRAHLAFLGKPILGDDLYGERTKNKKVNALRLTAYRLRFNFRSGRLAYLSNTEFVLKNEPTRYLADCSNLKI